LGRVGRGIGVGAALYAAVFALMLVAYRMYLDDPAAAPVVGSFPAPTAVMLYLLWPASPSPPGRPRCRGTWRPCSTPDPGPAGAPLH
jgi:hypothetical protein